MLFCPSIPRLKQSLFQTFIGIRCFDITSQSLVILIFLFRIITQLTIYDYQSEINDSVLSYFITIQKISKLTGKQNVITNQNIIFVISISVIMVLFYFCVFLHMKINSSWVEKKYNLIKIQGVFFMTFRVFIIKNLSEISLIALNINNYMFFTLTIVISLLVILQIYLIQQFTIQISLIKLNKSLLSKCYHIFNGISQVLLLLTVMTIVFIPKQRFQIISIVNIILSVSFLLKLSTLLFRKKYTQQLVENLQIISGILCMVFYLLFIPAHFIQLLKENFFLCMVAIVLFLYKSFTNFLEYFQEDSIMYLESIPKMRQELLSRSSSFYLAQGHYLIHFINHLMRQFRGQKEEILLGSILSEHFRLCKDPSCYCMNRHYENKNKLIIQTQFRSKLLLSFVQNIHRQFCQQFDIFVLYLIFKLQIVGIFPEIQSSLVKYQQTNTSLKIYQEFIIYQIKKLLKNFIDDKNKNYDNVKLEKVLIQADIQKQFMRKLEQLLQLNIKKYKLLSQAICNLNLVEENCLATAKLTKMIELEYFQSKNRNQYNLYTQSMYYFYYSKISQTNTQASTIFNNIYTKNRYLKSLKGYTTVNIQKFMYENRCVVLQSFLQSQKIGIVTNVTQNCLQIFGIKKQDLLYKNIRRLIPKFMNQQHDKLLKQWVQTGSFRNFNKRKITYVNNSKSICFKAMIYLQVSTTFQRIKIYTMVFKIQGQNYLLLDNKFNIQAYGEKIKDYVFSMKVLQQPLRKYCYNMKSIQSDWKNMELEKKFYIELYLSEDKQASSDIAKNNLKQSTFAEKIQQFADSALRKNKQFLVFRCRIQFSMMKLAKLTYFIMKFVDIAQLVMTQSQLDEFDVEYSHSNQNIGKYKVLKNNQKGSKNVEKSVKKNLQERLKNNQISKTDQIIKNESEISLTQENQQEQLDPQDFQSASSLMTEEASYSFKKLINHIKQTFLFEKGINYLELNNVTIVLLILILIILGCLIFQYFFYQTRLKNFQKIMIANQQVSDTLQYLQLMFSQLILVAQNCLLSRNQIQCTKSIGQLQTNSDNFYQKISLQYLNSIKQKATQTFGQYMYLSQQISIKIGRSTNTLTIHNFIETFYYSTKKIIKHFIQNSITSQTYFLIGVLNDNWNVIIQINQNILNIYQRQGLSQMDLIQIILYIVSGVIFGVNIIILIVTNRFINKSLKRKEIMIKTYELVPVSYVQAMRKYFQQIMKLLNKKKFIYNNQDISFPCIDQNPYYRPKTQFFYNISSIKRILFFIIFFILLIMSNLISMYNMRNVLQPFRNIFIEQTNMILAQKSVFESYYQLKQLYMLQTNKTIRNNSLKKLKEFYKKSQVEFNYRVLNLLKMFEDSENNYTVQFKKLLSDDICELTKDSITQWQYKTCKQTFYKYPQHGVFASIIFVHRAATIAQSQLSSLQQLSPQKITQFFTMKYYLDVDIYSSYLMRVFYLLQTRIAEQMKISLKSAYDTCLFTIMCQIILLILMMMLWGGFYKYKKKEFVELYGNAMVFPSRIIKKTKKVLKDVEDCLVLKDY